MNKHDIDQANARLARVEALLEEAKREGAEHDECMFQVKGQHELAARALADADAADKEAKTWLEKARGHRERMEACIAKVTSLQDGVRKALGQEVVDG